MLPQGATEHYVDLPGLRMHYVAMGPEDGTPVLLLHGFPEFWYSWRHQMPALAAAGYRAIAPDQRGYNLTEKQGPYNVETLVADIACLQDALGYARTHVVGHDWGGVAAWAFASFHAARVDRLVTMNGPHPAAYMHAVRAGWEQRRRSWYIYFFQIPWLPEWALRRRNGAALREMFAHLPKQYMSDADIDRYVEAALRPGALKAMVGWYRALPSAILRNGGGLPNPHIGVPTCVIWGERDVALAKSCNDALPKYVRDLEVHYLPRATHWCPIDHPDEVNRLLIDFLGRGR